MAYPHTFEIDILHYFGRIVSTALKMVYIDRFEIPVKKETGGHPPVNM